MNSIQSKLASGLAVSLTLVLLLLWFVVSNNIQKLSENYIASRLEHDIETLLTAINFNINNELVINEQLINSIYKRPFSGHYYTIIHQGNILRSRSLWDQSLSIPKITNTDYIKSNQIGPDNQSLITITRRFNKQNQTITISISEDLSPTINDINQFKKYFSILSLMIFFILLAIQFIVLKNGLRSLKNIRGELNKLEKGAIDKLSTDVPYELEPLVNEVNHLSLALYKRLKRSRDALSDLSHAIKKPLTLLQQFSDTNNSKNDNASISFLNEQISSIQHITDRILKRARVAGASKFNTPFSINDDLPILLKTIAMMYPEKNIHISLEIPKTMETLIDREDMLELLGNLLDNAWKWAKTTININFIKTHQIVIIIEDDGPGANTDSLNELTQRGVRLDESVHGYGFGLAISSDIINDYEGDLIFSHSDILGGFKVEIHLPDAR